MDPICTVGGLSRIIGVGRALFRFLEVDSAVIYVLLARAWRLPAACVTLFLISQRLSPEAQGFYYTFASIVALGSFLELGFFLVIINVASNEWARLGLDRAGTIVGHPDALSRLVSLGRLSFKWYSVGCIIFFLVITPAGYLFFSQSPEHQVQWLAPWISLVFVSSLSYGLLSFNSILEGCNQVAQINRFRLYQSVLVNLILWTGLLLHTELWFVVMSASAGLLSNIGFLFARYRSFFGTFLRVPPGPTISWRDEIWPMQWRIGVGGTVSYFAFFLFNPVMFHYHGPVIAGQMGMTREAITVLEQTAMAWVSTKVPTYGMLISERRYNELDRLWLRCSLVSLGVIALGAAVMLVLLYLINVAQWSIAGRLLPPLPTGIFLCAAFFTQISQCISGYLRAHRKEPTFLLSVVTGVAMGLMVWVSGERFGPMGAAIGALIIWMLHVLWAIRVWLRCRTQWHTDADGVATEEVIPSSFPKGRIAGGNPFAKGLSPGPPSENS